MTPGTNPGVNPGVNGGLPEFLTPRQVAELLHVKETTVTLWIRRGLLEGVRIGHLWRISRAAFDRFTSGV